ncbi:carbohydrate-binding protein, partial [Micromonospora sp. DH15]|nr:carbohydrate-binding protein [Micromonospora sp. DH15]
YNSDGTIPSMHMTTTGAPQVGTLNPYVRQEAETIAWSVGVETEPASEGGMNASFLSNGDYIKVKGVAFGAGASSFSARVASAGSGGTIEVRLGGPTGTRVGACTVPVTGGWQTWQTVSCPVTGATGTQDLYLRFTGGSGNLFNLNWWQFGTGSNPTPTPTTPPAGQSCGVTYTQVGSWSGGYEGRLTITNTGGAAISGWRVTFSLPSGQSLSQGWNATFGQQGSQVTVTNAAYNGQLTTGGSTTAGFIASSTGTPQAPTSLTCTSS